MVTELKITIEFVEQITLRISASKSRNGMNSPTRRPTTGPPPGSAAPTCRPARRKRERAAAALTAV